MSEGEGAFDALHPALRHHIVNTFEWSGLRPVQALSVAPIRRGDNVVVLAPTAGGKTEAAFFPLLSNLLDEQWRPTSVLYLSPIRALLNNQFERLSRLCGLLGLRAGVWHGDVGQAERREMRRDPPDVLLTTPESIEAMAISRSAGSGRLLESVRAVVIDEVHAFAGDDRGWHLLGVLDRVAERSGHDLHRIGLSATVGNREEIVQWLSARSARGRATVDPPRVGASAPEITLDNVGSLDNAAKVIAALHRGEKRLVFCDSRLQAEQLGRALRAAGVTVHVTHSSLSADERRVADRAFTEGGPGVIVATSALELGIDIGDLDRVIQVDAPYTVASMLQRMGRTGRRPGAVTNLLMLATTDAGLLRGAALLDLWRAGHVEPARAPRRPYHVLAQQALARALERPGLIRDDLEAGLAGLAAASETPLAGVSALVDHLLAERYLFADGARLGLGAQAEAEVGRKNFLELVSVFTSPPLMTVMYGTRELGSVHESTFDGEGPRVILLGGRSWLVEDVAWGRRVAYVSPFDAPGKSRWIGAGAGMSRELAEAHRRVMRGEARLEGLLSRRAEIALSELLPEFGFVPPTEETWLRLVDRVEGWTFAGTRANARRAAWLREQGWEAVSSDGLVVRATPAAEAAVPPHPAAKGWEPSVDPADPRLRGLKFGTMLPGEQLREAALARLY